MKAFSCNYIINNFATISYVMFYSVSSAPTGWASSVGSGTRSHHPTKPNHMGITLIVVGGISEE